MSNQEKKLVGFDVTKADVGVEDGQVKGDVVAEHVGKIGSLKISLEAKLDAKPFLHKAVDMIEKAIPGDQSKWANMAKLAIDNIKF